MFTGAVTFHRSPVRVSHGRFLGARAEDALNIIRAEFESTNSEFADTASESDAFDGDFTEGVFERSIFHNIAADGIDARGSEVTVQDARFYNLGDKALSAELRQIYLPREEFRNICDKISDRARFVEGINRAIRGIINRAFGYRNFDDFTPRIRVDPHNLGLSNR